jgi:hypothetical protein
MLKIAVFAPIPRASLRTTTNVRPGPLFSKRAPKRMSCHSVSGPSKRPDGSASLSDPRHVSEVAYCCLAGIITRDSCFAIFLCAHRQMEFHFIVQVAVQLPSLCRRPKALPKFVELFEPHSPLPSVAFTRSARPPSGRHALRARPGGTMTARPRQGPRWKPSAAFRDR